VNYHAEKKQLVRVFKSCPRRPYLDLTILTFLTMIVRRLASTIVSHDQGYSGEDKDFQGTYTGSETFPEAQIVTPSSHDRVIRRPTQYNVHRGLRVPTTCPRMESQGC
jgi:hypothetical protein